MNSIFSVFGVIFFFTLSFFFFSQEETSSKKRKLNNKKAKETFVPSQTSKKSVPEQVRRSTRARQSNKDRKIIPINKFMTLKDLKVMVREINFWQSYLVVRM